MINVRRIAYFNFELLEEVGGRRGRWRVCDNTIYGR